jgi:hypothetical protein
LPRKKIPLDVRSLARAHTNDCIKRLAGYVRNPGKDQPESATIAAAAILLDRGWGRAMQPVSGEDGKAIEITIRKMLGEDE